MAEECRACQALIDASFVGGPALRPWRRIQDHLKSCQDCRRYYDRVALVSGALVPDDGLPRDASAMIGLDLVQRFGAGATGMGLRGPRFWVPALLGILAVVAGATILRSRSGEFQARGAKAESGGAVRAFCLDGAGKIVATAGANSELRCPLDGTLQLGYTAPPQPGVYLAVFGLDDAGSANPYHASIADSASVSMKAGAVDEPLPHSVRLQVNHHVGRVRVVAVFSDHRLSAADAEAAARASARKEAPPAGILSSQSLWLEVTP